MKVLKYLKQQSKDTIKALYKKTAIFNNKKRILHRRYRKISYIVIALLVIVNMTIFSFNAFSQMGVQEANSLESYAVVAYTEPGSHTWTVPNGVSSVDVLVVAGGGGGGGSTAGGGGGGGVIFEQGYSVTPGESISISVGDGGSGTPRADQSAPINTSGEDSTFNALTAIGGGAGFSGGRSSHGHSGKVAEDGGSGGGSGYYSGNTLGVTSPGSGTTNQGNSGGSVIESNWGGAGGGGAGAAGEDFNGTTGAGGDGLYYGDIFGEEYGENGWFGGGGGGGYHNSGESAGGLGGGGKGADGNTYIAQPGMENTGGGSGGGGYYQYGPGSSDGGSGVVIVKYKVNLGTLQGSTLNKGLIGHWSMDGVDYNSSTNRITDKTPYSNHGTNYGATFTTDRNGRADGAMSFDGSNDYIQTSITGTFPQASFCFWGYFDDPALDTKSRDESAFGDWNSSRIHFGTRWGVGMHWNVNSSWTEIPTTNLNYGWNHYCLTWDDSTNQKLVYINNILSSSNSTNGNITIGDLKIGNATNLNHYYRGNIDDFRIYNRALSESEIQSLYDSYEPKISAGSLNKGLVLDMPLTLKYTKDETSGSEIMTDKTPYSNDGQNYGATITAEGASFDGSNDYINVGSLGLLYNQGTISFWMNPSVIENHRNPFTTNYAGANTAIRFEENSSGRFGVVIGNDSGTYSSPTYLSSGLQTNQWYHVILVWDKLTNNVKGYLNGISKFNQSHTLWPTTMPATAIGSGFTTAAERQWKGQINNVRIYNRAISETEVKSLYDKGRDSSSGMTIKPYGSVPGMAGLSCLDILNNNPSAINNDGLYWINPDGTGAFQVYCDMTTDGGGWTLATNIIDTAANNVPDTVSAVRAGWTEVSEGNLTSFSGAIAKDLSYFIGVDKLTDGLNPSNIRLCAIKNEDDKRCHSSGILASHYTFTGDSGVSASNNYLKMAATLSGTVDYGATVNGSDGKFVNYDLYLFKGDSYSGGGYVQQWSGDTANWHVWGYGVTQTNNLTNNQEIYNHGNSDSGILREYTEGWEVWLR